MSLDQRIDEYIDRILKASGSAIKNYTLSSTIDAMRYEVRAMCIAEYMKGSEDCHKAHMSATHNAPQGGRGRG